MLRFTKQLVLMLLFLVVINAERRQRNAQSLDERMGDLLPETRGDKTPWESNPVFWQQLLDLLNWTGYHTGWKTLEITHHGGNGGGKRGLRQRNALSLDERMGHLLPETRGDKTPWESNPVFWQQLLDLLNWTGYHTGWKTLEITHHGGNGGGKRGLRQRNARLRG